MERPNLEAMTKRQLVDYAATIKIGLSPRLSKDVLIFYIERRLMEMENGKTTTD